MFKIITITFNQIKKAFDEELLNRFISSRLEEQGADLFLPTLVSVGIRTSKGFRRQSTLLLAQLG